MMSQTKPFDQMTPEERQKLIDDFCQGLVLLKKAVQEAARAIVAAWNSIPPGSQGCIACRGRGAR
jgi:hypothetical protein